jgi:hypothetical protein
MDAAELDRMAQAELEKEGILFADPLPHAQFEPPQAAAGKAKTRAQWALFVFLVALDVFMAVTLL